MRKEDRKAKIQYSAEKPESRILQKGRDKITLPEIYPGFFLTLVTKNIIRIQIRGSGSFPAI
jgi:hypothetical protein